LTITSAQHIKQFTAYRPQPTANALGKALTPGLQFRLSTALRLTDSPLLFISPPGSNPDSVQPPLPAPRSPLGMRTGN